MGERGRVLSLSIAVVLVVLVTGGTADAASVGLDPSFDGDGTAITVFPQASQASAIAIQSDGKIVAAGQSYDAGFAGSFTLVRYNADGSLDTSFDGDGIVTTTIGASSSWINSIAIQSDGKIVAGGVSYVGFYYDFTVARYNTDGSLDTSFDTDGIVTTSFGSEYDTLEAIGIDANGKIVAGGYTDTSNIRDFALARFNSDGSLDSSFDTDGKVTTAAGTFLNSISIQSDGRIVAGGSNNDSGSDFMLARYNTDGSLDAAFGSGGLVTTDVGGYEGINSIAVASSGEIVVGGSGSGLFIVARYDSSGVLDSSFDLDGIVSTSIRGASDGISSVAIQSDGKIVAGGNSSVSTDPGNFMAPYDSDFALARYNPDGSLDTVFDSDGKVTTDLGGNNDAINSLTIAADGMLFIGGYSSAPGGFNFTVARYVEEVANTPPDTSIDTQPADPSNSADAQFTFSADEPSTFECDLDDGGFASCSSPKDYAGLADGEHTFQVRATDGLGSTDASPASYTWTIDTPSPPSPVFYPLTVSTAGTGSGTVTGDSYLGIDCGTDCSSLLAQFTFGSLTATPDDGSEFSGWSGPCLDRPEDPPDRCTIHLTWTQNVTATFSKIEEPPPPALCADGLDNDGDGLIDFPSDPGCADASGNDETDPAPTVTEHARALTVDVIDPTSSGGHRLVFEGMLETTDGFAPCSAGNEVVLQKRSGNGWRDRKTATTDDEGLFGFSHRAKSGTYRVLARALTLAGDPVSDACLRAMSEKLHLSK